GNLRRQFRAPVADQARDFFGSAGTEGDVVADDEAHFRAVVDRRQLRVYELARARVVERGGEARRFEQLAERGQGERRQLHGIHRAAIPRAKPTTVMLPEKPRRAPAALVDTLKAATCKRGRSASMAFRKGSIWLCSSVKLTSCDTINHSPT